MFMEHVNAACINVLFMPERISGMHESLRRLYEAAKAATAHLPLERRLGVDSPSALGRALNVSAAVMTNWKARGVSIEGAVNAEGLFGCSAWWILKGEQPPGWRGQDNMGPLSAEVLERLSRDARAASMWESAIRGALGMHPNATDSGNRHAA